MKFYRVSGQTGADSFKVLWATSKYAASLCVTEVAKLADEVEVQEVNVPTGRLALLNWLNKNCVEETK